MSEYAVLRDLVARLVRAEDSLRDIGIDAKGAERARIAGKAQGVNLARSYAQEALRMARDLSVATTHPATADKGEHAPNEEPSQ